nr:proline-rich receptor-like protein kinase PERK9 [Lolium perenne]
MRRSFRETLPKFSPAPPLASACARRPPSAPPPPPAPSARARAARLLLCPGLVRAAASSRALRPRPRRRFLLCRPVRAAASSRALRPHAPPPLSASSARSPRSPRSHAPPRARPPPPAAVRRPPPGRLLLSDAPPAPPHRPPSRGESQEPEPHLSDVEASVLEHCAFFRDDVFVLHVSANANIITMANEKSRNKPANEITESKELSL